jgi:hypothetical protein
MGGGLSMSSRAEITTKFAKAYVKASKADKDRSGSDGGGHLLVA